ncbi:MAG: hypothetical protein JRF63_11975 [Deltaproteobacteria bacterium]|nr:hypothetical protein [Deltaproteobacteria bacterium]
MRAALLLGIAALLMLGCGAAEYKGKVTSQYTPGYSSGTSVATAGSPATAIDDPAAMPEYQAREQNRPDQHEMAVHNYHNQQRAKARNTDYWSVNQVKTDSADKEAIDMIKKQREAVASGGEVGEPGPSTVVTDRVKKEAMRRLRRQREAVANAMGDCVGGTKGRLDLSTKDLNASKMPGNGLVGMQPHDHYITKRECQGSCLNKSLGNKAKMDRMGNPLGQ